jgi:hypothetical protein
MLIHLQIITQASLQPTKVANELPIRLNLLLNYLLFLIPRQVISSLPLVVSASALLTKLARVKSSIYNRLETRIYKFSTSIEAAKGRLVYGTFSMIPSNYSTN